jgi:hypothetical protein
VHSRALLKAEGESIRSEAKIMMPSTRDQTICFNIVRPVLFSPGCRPDQAAKTVIITSKPRCDVTLGIGPVAGFLQIQGAGKKHAELMT